MISRDAGDLDDLRSPLRLSTRGQAFAGQESHCAARREGVALGASTNAGCWSEWFAFFPRGSINLTVSVAGLL